MDYPEVIVIGQNRKDGFNIIKGILNDPLPTPKLSPGLEKYQWLIDNKYYSSEIYLTRVLNIIDTSIISLFQFAEAIILYIDIEESALYDVDIMLEGFMLENVEVKLLVCDGFTESKSGLTRVKAQEWCIKHGWELVELNMEMNDSEEEDSLEDDFIDSYGFTRISQALNAHTWSNLCLKDKKKEAPIDFSLLKHLNLNDGKHKEDILYETLASESKGGNSDDKVDGDDFTVLFESLGKMKETANSLPLEERRDYAAKIAFAFLKSLGDENECDDLDSG